MVSSQFVISIRFALTRLPVGPFGAHGDDLADLDGRYFVAGLQDDVRDLDGAGLGAEFDPAVPGGWKGRAQRIEHRIDFGFCPELCQQIGAEIGGRSDDDNAGENSDERLTHQVIPLVSAIATAYPLI